MAWDPPWPPVQISDCEWVVVRNSIAKPKAVIRHFPKTPERPEYFRVVSWAPTSEGRELLGRFPTLAEADQSVKFSVPRGVGPKAMTTEQLRPIDWSKTAPSPGQRAALEAAAASGPLPSHAAASATERS